jgi:hypothetical protein
VGEGGCNRVWLFTNHKGLGRREEKGAMGFVKAILHQAQAQACERAIKHCGMTLSKNRQRDEYTVDHLPKVPQ